MPYESQRLVLDKKVGNKPKMVKGISLEKYKVPDEYYNNMRKIFEAKYPNKKWFNFSRKKKDL